MRGLSSREAAGRLASYGPNRLVRRERLRTLAALLGALLDPMALMLAAAGVVYLLLGQRSEAWVLFGSLVPVLGVDVALDLRSRAALRKLAATVSPRARVVRDGGAQEIASEALVPGDLLLLGEGEVVHADCLVRQQANLTCDESQLTGESEPQAKEPGDQAWAGSLVLGGQGAAEVVETGARTRFGQIAELVSRTESAPTPLQRRTAGLVRKLGAVAVLLALAMIVFTLFRGQGLGQAVLAGISLAMAALPEEFPLVLALFLSLGAFRLSKKGVLVRSLASVETLGSTTVICTDKTGTLTEGRFSLQELVALDGTEPALLAVAVRACEREPEEPMEREILRVAQERHLPVPALHESELRFDYGFEPGEKLMAHVWREPSGRERLAAKGALEGLMLRCVLTAGQRAAALAAQERMARAGRRVLAVAERSGMFCGERGSDIFGLRLIGLLGFSDPLRPEVPLAIANCRRAGVRVKMITGDAAPTARAIAAEAGLADGPVLIGAELDAASAEQILAASIYARVQPGQKHRIVQVHQDAGEVVAMTGDGINDAPALRRADVGVSLGLRGTAVARAAADLVLLHDDFGALASAVAEGRRIFRNLVHAFLYLVAFHIPIVALAVIVPLLGVPGLLLPIHLVWLELIVHPVSALVFEAGGAQGVMDEPPRPPSAPLLPRRPLALSVFSGALLTAAALFRYLHALPAGAPAARSAALVVVIAGGLFLAFVEHQGPLARRAWLVLGLVALSLPLALWLPPLAAALQLGTLGGAGWALSVSLAAGSVFWRLGAEPWGWSGRRPLKRARQPG